MEKFLIEVPHGEDKKSCMRAIQVFNRSGSHFVTHADWGCLDGDHKAWMIVEVPDKNAARRILPAAYQHDAKITRLHRFSREEIWGPEKLLSKHTG
jgi:sugar lactone lactonase YvrE